MSLPRRAGWFRRWRFGRRFVRKSEFSRGGGVPDDPPASPLRVPFAPSGGGSAATSAAQGLSRPEVAVPLPASGRAPTTTYPMCACGVPLPLHREHEPCRDFERVAGGRQPASSVPGDALGVSVGQQEHPAA